MSKVRVDQLSPTDDSLTVNVKDLQLVNDLVTESANLPNGMVNISQAVSERIAALSSNTVRFCTWNIQGYYIVANENSPEAGDTVDTSRFQRDVSSAQRIRG